jgi:26S proteasome regulatory subunit N5
MFSDPALAKLEIH